MTVLATDRVARCGGHRCDATKMRIMRSASSL
jgi:hypothetical protein